MFDRFKSNKPGDPPEDGIVVLRQSKPYTCGGTDATLDTKAPTTIESGQMVSFSVHTAFGGVVSPETHEYQGPLLSYLFAFAVPAGSGTFLFLETRTDFDRQRSVQHALVKADVMPSLVRLVHELELAQKNGRHSTTYGLPQNFGGSVDICYASGETISFSDNQTPILPEKTGRAIAALFTEALAGEAVAPPDLSGLRAIRFEEDRGESGFTRAELTLTADGAGVNKKTSRYEDRVYESEKPVDAPTVEAIKNNIERCDMFAWVDLPRSRYAVGSEKTMTFVFADGTEITVTNQKALPSALSGGFFNIELELTTKH